MILITGGAGFIGSHTALALIENGYEVLIIDNLINSSTESIKAIQKITGKSVTFLEGDLRNEIFLKTVFDEYQITGVMHFAGVKSVGESNGNPIYYYDNNVTGTLNLIKEMAKGECRNLIFSSSLLIADEKPGRFFEDQPDVNDDYQIHFNYLLAADSEDREWDINGKMEKILLELNEAMAKATAEHKKGDGVEENIVSTLN